MKGERGVRIFCRVALFSCSLTTIRLHSAVIYRLLKAIADTPRPLYVYATMKGLHCSKKWRQVHRQIRGIVRKVFFDIHIFSTLQYLYLSIYQSCSLYITPTVLYETKRILYHRLISINSTSVRTSVVWNRRYLHQDVAEYAA